MVDLDIAARAVGLASVWSEGALLSAFWLTLLIEIPRYFVGVQATVAALMLRTDRVPGAIGTMPKVSILLVGHNEEDSIEKCVRSLGQQTFVDFEIVCVDDGSNDKTFSIMSRLRREGLVSAAARVDLRGSKPSGINLAARLAKGDIFVVVDCDCSFEPDAIERLLKPLFDDGGVAAVSGNILVRNWRRTIIASLQGIEYLLSISLGKTYANILNQVCCVSGAYGAFRRGPWERIGGMDPGGGEDLDFTIRLRLAGYRVVFVRDSVCYTDVPETLYSLLKQRNRWERDAFALRLRKFKRLYNPLGRTFSWQELIHQWDFLLFNLLPTIVFPFYVTWLLVEYGEFGLVVLVAVSITLFVFDIINFASAVLVTGHPVYWRLFPFLPIFGFVQSYVMRLQRIYAYVTEWSLSLSLKDNYTPQKTRDWEVWR